MYKTDELDKDFFGYDIPGAKASEEEMPEDVDLKNKVENELSKRKHSINKARDVVMYLEMMDSIFFMKRVVKHKPKDEVGSWHICIKSYPPGDYDATFAFPFALSKEIATLTLDRIEDGVQRLLLEHGCDLSKKE